jgi:hypothetical protein
MLSHFFIPDPADKCIGCLPLDEVQRKPNKGLVGQLLKGDSKLLQRLANQLGSGYQLEVVCHSQMVVPTVIFKYPDLSLPTLLLQGHCAEWKVGM